MRYFLGIDVGGSKSHALLADETGRAVGFGAGGPGNWEGVGYDGLTRTLLEITRQALEMAGADCSQVAGAGLGMGGFDWPSQRQAHLNAITPLGLACPIEICNDATLGIWAGTSAGWGVSVVAGSGCNVRALSRDRQREGRMVGGAGEWSGEWVGGFGLTCAALRRVSFEWTRRGPATALTPAFIAHYGALSLDDLMEGLYLSRYPIRGRDALLIFRLAGKGDPDALDVVRLAGAELGEMACGAIRQVGLESEPFEVVLIGSLHDGHPAMRESMMAVIHQLAPLAQAVRLDVPPVVGGALLGMHAAGLEPQAVRPGLLRTTRLLLDTISIEPGGENV